MLKRLTATFGTLCKQRLELHEGLNIITAPNESGKSTWASFLLAMLYGVDTAERATKSNLPAKTRYKPWNGQPMEGSAEVVAAGRSVTIERTSQGKTPLGQFRAFDSDTGRTLDALREDTCGQTLVGVERSVYERSGFIRQQGMAVTGDHALEARLGALVTTGDETVSYGAVEQRLRDLRNRRRHHKTGLLPQAEAELAGVQDALAGIAQLGRDIMALQARRAALEAEQRELARIDGALKAQAASEKRRQLEQARQDWEKKSRFLEEKQQTVRGLPPLEDLQALARELDLLAESGKLLESDLRLGVGRPEKPDCPPVFSGLSPDQVRETAENDVRRLEQLGGHGGRNVWILAWIAFCCLALGVAGILLRIAAMAAAGVATSLFAGVLAYLRYRREFRKQEEIRELFKRYGVQSKEEILRMTSAYREDLLLFAQKTIAADEKQSALDARRAQFEAQQAELLRQTGAFADGCATLSAARSAAQNAVHRQLFYQAAQREAQNARAQYQAVLAAVGPLPEQLRQAEPLAQAYDPVQVAARLAAVGRELQDVRSQLDLRRGRMEAAGDPAVLNAQRETLTERIERLQREYDALTLAMDALARANETLQTRFSPRLNELAGQYMARMTGERYDKVLLGQDMSVTAREAGETVTRSALALSGGTVDQLYLAVRLAICRLALPEDAPLVLDDALVSFDDARMGAALALLRELSETRQILLFTCQNREQAWLDSQAAP